SRWSKASEMLVGPMTPDKPRTGFRSSAEGPRPSLTRFSFRRLDRVLQEKVFDQGLLRPIEGNDDRPRLLYDLAIERLHKSLLGDPHHERHYFWGPMRDEDETRPQRHDDHTVGGAETPEAHGLI